MSVPYVYRKRRWRLLFGTTDSLGYLMHRPRPLVPELGDARLVLVVKLDQVGDLILTLPLIERLRSRAPHARIELAVGEGRRAVLEGQKGIDAVHELPVRLRAGEGPNRIGIRRLAGAMRSLRSAGFDAVVAAKEEPLTVLVSRLAGGRTRLGFREGGLGFLLTHYVPLETAGRHQWEVLASLAGSGGPACGPPRYFVTEKARADAAELDARLRGAQRIPLVVIHPGAGIPARRWGAARFIETAAGLASRVPSVIVMVTGPDEPRLSRLPDVPSPSRLVALDRPLPLSLFAALLERAALLIGNESAPGHLAAAVGTPTVTVTISGNDPRRWCPYGTANPVVEGTAASPPPAAAVIQAAARLLAARAS